MSRPGTAGAGAVTSADHDDHDDETALLASLGLDAGSALQSASEYESTVIRRAELSAAPQLIQDGGGGIRFPADLSGLAPGLAPVDDDGGRRSGKRRSRRRRLAEDEMDALLDVLVDLRTELSHLLHSSGGSSSSSSSSNSNAVNAVSPYSTPYESAPANHLRLQQQLLLNYLLHHCGYDGATRQGQEDVWDTIQQRTGYDARTERDEERERRSWIAAATMADAAGAGDKDGEEDVPIDKEDDAARCSADAAGGTSSRKRRGSSRSGGNGPVANLDGMSAQQRLEHIKGFDDNISSNNNNNNSNADDSRKVTFAGGPNGTGTPGSATKRRRKATMMSIRNQMDAESGVAGARRQNAEEAERRRQRRMARRERRRERTERALGSFVEKRRETRRKERAPTNGGGGSGQRSSAGGGRIGRSGDASSDEAELEFDDEDGATKKTPAADSAGPPRPPKQTVSCPLCSADVEIEDSGDADATLSAHIDDCQRQRGGRGARRRRGGERSAAAGSRRAAAAKQISYSETNSGDEDGEVVEECYHFEEIEEESSEEEEKKSDSSSSRPKSTKRSAQKSSISNLDTRSDDESMLSCSSPPPDFEPSDLDHDAPTGDEDLDSLPFNSAPDDLEEANYDDRVDVWQEVGVKRMKDMAERDDDTHEDAMPGPVMHDGGLVIPGWMNNRLFGYQRTGVRWMWELHRQEAGGIVGDEMVG